MSNQKIDFVVTWVNQNDEEWLNKKKRYENDNLKGDNTVQRYRDWGLFKYWFRCVEKNAPWVNRIFLITDKQVPAWINLDNKKIKIINHEEILEREKLPTFNSNAIEFGIGNIKELSEYFVYFNDDVFITRKIKPKDFFKNGNPVDNFGLNIIRSYDGEIGESVLNDMKIVNRIIPKKNLKTSTKIKMFSPKNGPLLIKTLLLAPFNHFCAFYDSHSAIAFRKSFFLNIQKKFSAEVEKTQDNRFRQKDDISIWVIRYLYEALGEFAVRNNLHFSKYMEPTSDNIRIIEKMVKNPKYKLLCINDSQRCNSNIEENSKLIKKAFEARYSEKSSFEI